MYDLCSNLRCHSFKILEVKGWLEGGGGIRSPPLVPKDQNKPGLHRVKVLKIHM